MGKERGANAESEAGPAWGRRLVHEIRNPRLPTLIGFALAVMIAAALLAAGRLADAPASGEDPAEASGAAAGTDGSAGGP